MLFQGAPYLLSNQSQTPFPNVYLFIYVFNGLKSYCVPWLAATPRFVICLSNPKHVQRCWHAGWHCVPELSSVPSLGPCLLILHCWACTFMTRSTHSFLSFLNFSCMSVLAFSHSSFLCLSQLLLRRAGKAPPCLPLWPLVYD